MGTKIWCHNCDDVIESKGHRHNFVECRCGETFVDGGDCYSRFGGTNLSVWDNGKQEWVPIVWDDPLNDGD